MLCIYFFVNRRNCSRLFLGYFFYMFIILKRYICINGINYLLFFLFGEIFSKFCIFVYNIFILFGILNLVIFSIFFLKVYIEFKMKIMRFVFVRIINKLIDCLID